MKTTAMAASAVHLVRNRQAAWTKTGGSLGHGRIITEGKKRTPPKRGSEQKS
jgi:hypothetical protein